MRVLPKSAKLGDDQTAHRCRIFGQTNNDQTNNSDAVI
jgi:hypothetical protein